MSLELLVVLLLVLGAEFVNGRTDAPNAIATVVGTRSLSPRIALAMASIFKLIGVLSETAVAVTIGKGIIGSGAVNLITIGGAMMGIIVWSECRSALRHSDQREPCACFRPCGRWAGIRLTNGSSVGRMAEGSSGVALFEFSWSRDRVLLDARRLLGH